MWEGYKSLGDFMAELKMTLAPGQAVLAVEGKDDMRFWWPRRHPNCYLVEGEGKPNVVRGICQLDEAGQSRAVGVVDRDYDMPPDHALPSANLVATDAHDLESVLCRSNALDRALAEYGDQAKIAAFEAREGRSVRTGLLERALVFGRLRWAAFREGTPLDIRVAQFTSEADWTVDEARLLEAAQRQVAREMSLAEHIRTLPNTDPWYIVHGKDLIELLRVGLRRVIGSLQVQVGVAHIAGALRIGMPDADPTGMWQDIRGWEARNPPYAVLPPEPAGT